jgi:hypothetical protein
MVKSRAASFLHNYLLTFIQFSDFYQEAIFWGKKHIPQIFANVFQNSKHSKEEKTTDYECCLNFSPQFVTMNIDNITQKSTKDLY